MYRKKFNSILTNIFDDYILSDIETKVIEFEGLNSEEIADLLIDYVQRHYIAYENHVIPKITNFYGNHKKFTRFLLIAVSLWGNENDVQKMIQEYKFNKALKWEIKHIIPQSQSYNKLNQKNTTSINKLGNLTLLTEETNSKISNNSFHSKRQNLKKMESDLLINEVFQIPKIHISKKILIDREKELNQYIFDIFFKDNGKKIKNAINYLNMI